jgi:hypothetical protein
VIGTATTFLNKVFLKSAQLDESNLGYEWEKLGLAVNHLSAENMVA